MTVPDVAKVAASIEAACVRAGRDPKSVRLLAVTKQVPAEAIRQAADLGVTLFGENRVQEAREKAGEGAFLGSTLCLIGHLQSNKAALAARLFDEVHSVDSPRIAFALGKAAARYRTAPLPVLIEVNAGEDPAKFGVLPSGAKELALAVMEMPGLALKGLMTVAPGYGDAEMARSAFRRLRQVRDDLRDAGIPDAALQELSMGMSGDYEIAISEGSTIVRIGTALFGPRRLR
ncbi:MAG: YggS family pyridoxal phosphate-dependent enzyme [Bacillota bacterium]